MDDSLKPDDGQAFQSSLEKQFIVDYLNKRGYLPEDLLSLNPILAKEIMIRACRHASLKLTEIESRSHFIQKLHVGVSG